MQRMDSLSSSNNNNSQDSPEGLPLQETATVDRPMTTPPIINNNNVSSFVDSNIVQHSNSNIDANAYAEETKTGLGDGTNVPSLDESSIDEENNNNNNNDIDDDSKDNHRGGGGQG